MTHAASSKKILLISSLFYPTIGGTENECRKLAGKFLERGHEVTVLTAYREDLPAHEVIDGIQVYRFIKSWHLFEFSFMLSVLSFLIKHRKHFQVVICFGLYLFTAPAIIFCRLTGRKVFFRLESAGKTGDLYRIVQLRCGSFIRQCAKMAHGVIAISEQIRKELLVNGFNPAKISRIPNGVDTAVFTPAPPKDSAMFSICYIGRLAAGKGLDTLIQALAGLKKHTSRFQATIVGSGEAKVSLQQQALALGLKKQIVFVEETDNVVPYYHRSDVFVLPSHSEGMPLTLLEAMACGVCTIASQVGGIVDLMGPQQTGSPQQEDYRICSNGIMIAPGADHALTAALILLKNNQHMRKKLAGNALQTIADTYTLDRVIQKYIDLVSGTGV